MPSAVNKGASNYYGQWGFVEFSLPLRVSNVDGVGLPLSAQIPSKYNKNVFGPKFGFVAKIPYREVLTNIATKLDNADKSTWGKLVVRKGNKIIRILSPGVLGNGADFTHVFPINYFSNYI
ncbi:beta-1,3-glucanase family protein [Thiotrichales bacterium 19X7-9]|nr:beta-1,3-glucanase family protein [Thiotrichales bacterium 19X7-9]